MPAAPGLGPGQRQSARLSAQTSLREPKRQREGYEWREGWSSSRTAAAHDFVRETAASASHWCHTHHGEKAMGGDGLRPLPLIGLAELERLFVDKQHRLAAAAFALIRIRLRL